MQELPVDYLKVKKAVDTLKRPRDDAEFAIGYAKREVDVIDHDIINHENDIRRHEEGLREAKRRRVEAEEKVKEAEKALELVPNDLFLSLNKH